LFSDVLGVAGRVDLIAEFQGIRSVIDFKTSSKSKSEEKLLDYYIQETFYALAYTEMYGIEIDDIVTVMVIDNEAIPLIRKRKIAQYVPMLIKRIRIFRSNNAHTYQMLNGA
jgi:genome maintenance exonuclease 1